MKLLSDNYVRCEGMEYVVVGQDRGKSWALVTKILNLGSMNGRSNVT